VDPQCLSQRKVDRDFVVTKLLPQHLLGLGLVEVGRRHGAAPALGAPRRRQGQAVQRGTLRPRHHASGATTSRSHPLASLAPLARAHGLTQVVLSIGPTRGVRRHQQRPPLLRDPGWAGSPNEPTRAPGEGYEGSVPATSPPLPLLAAAPRPQP
jgi:hypothetical protein